MERGRVADVFSAPRHPYTAALLHSVPRIDSDTGSQLRAIPGSPPTPARLPSGCAFHPRCRFAIERCRADVPKLEVLVPGHSAACWVSAATGMPVVPEEDDLVRKARRTLSVEPVLRIENLRTDVNRGSGSFFSKAKPIFAVDGVSLEIRPGETLGLVGESGCGKSTLSRTIVGINPVAEGRITVAGRDVSAMDQEDRDTITKTIQYVFQDPFASLNPRRSIAQSLGEALGVAGVHGEKARQRSVELLLRVGLNEDFLERYPYELSGGQRQRVGFARALAADPAIMLMDEPFGAIDPITRVRLQDEFRQILKKVSKTVVIVTHDIDEAIKMGDRIAIMRDGRLLQYDTPEAILARPANEFVESFLGPDRAIKRLRLIAVASVMAPPAPQASAVSIKPDASLHDALALILAGDLPGLDVRAESGETMGYLSRGAVLSAHR
jgi:oligopeptide/dipeptide ABC transporter ATP-binding protein